ncbi:MAG: hypothetical protein JXB07_09705 [Anaerolineae bacterium]|nr:hypothetical protein [Anaerolineae bacterium]
MGTLAERSLHAALKEWYAQPGDRCEVDVDGYVIDIVRSEMLIEIQTRHCGKLKRKLERLIENHPVRLVHPIAQERRLVKLGQGGEIDERRKSPRRGRIEHVFGELVSIPHLIAHPLFELEVLIIREEEIRSNDGCGSWRRKGWSIVDRRLVEVLDRHLFQRPADFLPLLPDNLPQPFTNRSLAQALRQRVSVAQKMTYCLVKMGVLQTVGKQGNAHLYSIGSAFLVPESAGRLA